MTRIFGWVFLGAMIVATGYGTTAWPHEAKHNGCVIVGSDCKGDECGSNCGNPELFRITKRHCAPQPACDVASQTEWHGPPEGVTMTWRGDGGMQCNPALAPDSGGCYTLTASPPAVTIPGPLVIETDGSLITLDGGPLSFDGKAWTYKGKFHGDGSIVFKAAPK